MSPYELLGLDRDASEAQVRRAYRRLARRWHPDLNPGNAEAARQYAAITEAFDTLVDPVRRRAYRRLGCRRACRRRRHRRPLPASISRSRCRAPQASTFGDLFVDVFRQAAGGASGITRGADLHTEITLTLADVLHGGDAPGGRAAAGRVPVVRRPWRPRRATGALPHLRRRRAAAARARAHGVRAAVRRLPRRWRGWPAAMPWLPWAGTARRHGIRGDQPAARAGRRRSARAAR